MGLPKKAKFVIIGAGIHGLSTAWNIGEQLRAKGHSVKENDIIVLDKSGIDAAKMSRFYPLKKERTLNIEYNLKLNR